MLFFRPRGPAPLRPHIRCLCARINSVCFRNTWQCLSSPWMGALPASYTRQKGPYGWEAFQFATHLRSPWIRALPACYTRQTSIWMGAFQLATVTTRTRQVKNVTETMLFFKPRGPAPLRTHRRCLWTRLNPVCFLNTWQCLSRPWMGTLPASYTRHRGPYGWEAFKLATPQKSMDTGPSSLLHQTEVHMDGGFPACYRYGKNTPRKKRYRNHVIVQA